MAKISRNASCPCGSGKKYKKCHGGAQTAPRLSASNGTPTRLPPTSAEDVHMRMRAQFELHQAREQQRKQMQGLGNPIVSIEHADQRVVIVGGRWHVGNWRTFEDFLFYYIKTVLGPEWCTAELKKPETD